MLNHKLTDRQKDKYINNPYICPICSGDEITAEPANPETGYAEVKCDICHSTWCDVWKLVGIERVVKGNKNDKN